MRIIVHEYCAGREEAELPGYAGSGHDNDGVDDVRDKVAVLGEGP